MAGGRTGFILRRLLGAVPTLIVVIFVSFMMMRLAPGGPFDSERVLPPELRDNIEDYYRLDESLPEQFLRYLGGLLQGDLGPSYRYLDFTVSELIADSFPVSLIIAVAALALALLVGAALGVAAALNANGWLDRLVMTLAMAGLAVPVFVVAPLLLLVFAVWLDWLPAGFSSGEGAARYVLPVLALALPQVAFIARLLRASLIDVLSSEFIRNARAQGYTTAALLCHQALKPALLPLLSYLGPTLALLMVGSIVVEEVFGVPGLGQFFVRGALNRDYTLVLGIVIFYSIIVILANLLVDILYGLLDPRIGTPR